jgi:hypothetical protein
MGTAGACGRQEAARPAYIASRQKAAAMSEQSREELLLHRIHQLEHACSRWRRIALWLGVVLIAGLLNFIVLFAAQHASAVENGRWLNRRLQSEVHRAEDAEQQAEDARRALEKARKP